MAHVFISYHKSSSRDYARKLTDHLIASGFDVWIDDQLDYGEDWWKTVDQAIADCAAFIVIMSPEAETSRWIQREVMSAQGYNKTIYPLLSAGGTWSLFARTQYIDVRDEQLPAEDFMRALTASGLRRKQSHGSLVAQFATPKQLAQKQSVTRESLSPKNIPHIFISYHKQSSRSYARKLADHLIANGFDVWIDDRINFGDDWERMIFKALDGAKAVIVIMTPDSWESKWVQRERHYAESLGLRVFPFRLKGNIFPVYLATQVVDVQGEKLPPKDFLVELEACGVQRKSTIGQDVANPVISQPKLEPAPKALRPQRRFLRYGAILIFSLVGSLIWIILRPPNPTSVFPNLQTQVRENLTLTAEQWTDTLGITATPTPDFTSTAAYITEEYLAFASLTAEQWTQIPTRTSTRENSPLPPNATINPIRLTPTITTDSLLPANCTLYVIQAGDSPSRIAEQFGISRLDLFAVNGLDEESAPLLQIGQQLIIPLPGCPLLNAPLPTSANAQVEIVSIPGAGDISAEGIVLRNNGAVIDMTGWRLSDGGDHVYTFGSLRLFSSGQITLYTLPGLDTPVTLFWGLTQAIWQTGDIITLYDADGNVQSSVRVP